MIAHSKDWELHLGKWQDVLADVECDAIICDPPYGASTHAAKPTRNDAYVADGSGYGPSDGLIPKYDHWSAANIETFVTAWTDRCRGWMVALTSHDLIPAWESAFDAVGRYWFQPVPCVMRGMSVRLCGDGPSSWTVYALVARPATREFSTWGTLDGAYHGPRGTESGGGRGKPDWLMSALVRDYSRPGDLVCDPFAGWGSTLAAAVSNGRKAIGAEMDTDAFHEAVRRLERPLQVDMFGGAA